MDFLVRGFTAGLLVTSLVSGCSGDSSSGTDACSDVPGTACTWAGVKHERGGLEEEGTLRTETLLNFVIDLTFTPDGRAWIPDFNNHRIRVVENDRLYTVMGSGVEGDGSVGKTDLLPLGTPQGADALDVALNHPSDVEFTPDGKTLVLAAWHNNKIRVMDMETKVVTVLAGDDYGYKGDGGPAYMAAFNAPKAVVVDDAGNIYTIDQRNQRIRKISAGSPRMVDTIAGTGEIGFAGDGGSALQAKFAWDMGATPVPTGGLALRGRDLYISDSKNHRIRVMNLDSGIINTVAGTGVVGATGDGGPAIEATFNEPNDIEFGPDGRLYVVDALNNAIRAIDLQTGIIERVAGNGQQCTQVIYCYEETETPGALEVQLLQPWGIAFDPAGDLYIADTNNQRIVKVKQ